MQDKSSRRSFLHQGLTLAGAGVVLPAWLEQRVYAAPATGGLEDPVPTSGRAATAVVRSRHGIVVTASPGSAEAGLKALRDGGNAIDAAVAATIALCVTAPSSVGIGGYGGSMIVYLAKTGKIETLDCDSRAPKAYRPELYADKPKAAEYGYLAIGVPGVVAGLDMALKRYGTRSWRQLSETAIRLAEEGITVSEVMAEKLQRWARLTDKTSLKAIFPDGQLPTAGQRWKQPDLAKLIHQLGDDPLQFYQGDIAKKIIRQIQANGGILTEEDLRTYRPVIGEPLHISYRGNDLYTPTPPAGGITSLSVLKTLEQFDVAKMPRWSASYYDVLIEAMKLCWQERAQYFGDPDFVKIPYEELLSEQKAAQRAKLIREKAATRPAASIPPSGNHTVNVVAIDREGNTVSVTSTHGNGFGSCVVIEGMGMFLGHGMSRFNWKTGGPNTAQPGKRAQHNMAPLLVLKNGKPKAAIGLPGGTKLVNVTAQLAVNVLDYGISPGEAVNSPRAHVETEEPVLLSPEVSEAVAKELENMGHRITRNQNVAGTANVALIDQATGEMTAANSDGPEGIGAL